MHRPNDAFERYAFCDQALLHRDIVPNPVPARGLDDVGTGIGSRYRAEEVWIVGSSEGPGDIWRAFLRHLEQLRARGLDPTGCYEP